MSCFRVDIARLKVNVDLKRMKTEKKEKEIKKKKKKIRSRLKSTIRHGDTSERGCNRLVVNYDELAELRDKRVIN